MTVKLTCVLIVFGLLSGCEQRRRYDPPCGPAPEPCECLHWAEYAMQGFERGAHYWSAEKLGDEGCRAEGPYALLLPR